MADKALGESRNALFGMTQECQASPPEVTCAKLSMTKAV